MFGFQYDPTTPSTAKLNITNLHFKVSDADIKELFSEFKTYRSSAVHFDPSGRSKGAAHVIFGNRSDALKALKGYRGVKLDGRQLKISLAPPVQNRFSSPPKKTARKFDNNKVKRLQPKPADIKAKCTKEQLDQELDAYMAERSQ